MYCYEMASERKKNNCNINDRHCNFKTDVEPTENERLDFDLLRIVNRLNKSVNQFFNINLHLYVNSNNISYVS